MSAKKAVQVRKVRDFGSAISDTFSMFFQNFKLFAKVFIKIMAPIAVICALGVLVFALLAGSMDFVNPENDFPMAYAIMLGVLYFAFFILLMYCFIKLMIVAFRFVKIKADDPDKEVTETELISEIGAKTMPLLGRAILYMLLFIAFSVVVGALVYWLFMLIGGFAFLLLFFVFPLYMYIVIATSLYFVVSYEEDLSFIDSLKRSMYLVKNKWWLTFASTMAINMIASSIASFVQYIPLIFIAIGGALMPTDGAGLSVFIGIGGIITVVFVLASFLLYVVFFVFQSLWYYSLVEDKEGNSIINKINQIGEDDGELQYG